MPGLPLEDLCQVQFGGNVGAEHWLTGCWFKVDNAGTFLPSDMDSVLTALDTQILGIWTDFLGVWNASGLTLNKTLARFYRNNVLYQQAAHVVSAAAAGGTAPQAGFVSQVISLYTDTPSRATRGRMYLPRTGNAPAAATFQWTSVATQLGQLKTRLQAMETAISALPGTSVGAHLHVVSRTGVPSAPVTQLRADSKPDTQHGRTTAMVPSVLNTLTY